MYYNDLIREREKKSLQRKHLDYGNLTILFKALAMFAIKVFLGKSIINSVKNYLQGF